MSGESYLFVYGTLRRCCRHPEGRLLKRAEFIGPGRIKGRLFDLGPYPGAVFSARPGDHVHGELYKLPCPKGTLARLDSYEGCGPGQPQPEEFVRKSVKVTMTDGRLIEAWSYLYQGATSGRRPIPSGDYCSRSLRKGSGAGSPVWRVREQS